MERQTLAPPDENHRTMNLVRHQLLQHRTSSRPVICDFEHQPASMLRNLGFHPPLTVSCSSSAEFQETYMNKKGKLDEDVTEWNPRLWVEASGGLTRGRVYGAPYMDTNSLLNKGSKSSSLSDNITCHEDSTSPNVSASIMLTPEIKMLIKKEVQLALTSKYGSAASSQPPHSLQSQGTPQQFSFVQSANQIPQQPGQFQQSSFQFMQPSVPYHQTPGSFQSIPASCQQNLENFSQQLGTFTQLLGPFTHEYNPQPGQYQATQHHGTFHQLLNDDNVE